MLCFKVLFFTVFVALCTVAHAKEKCHYTIASKLGFLPLVFSGNEEELLTPNYKSQINVPHGDSIVFNCKQYQIENRPEHKIVATCNDGKLKDASGTVINEEILCQLRVIEMIPVKSSKCRDQMVQYVFYEKDATDNSVVAETCYDRELNLPIYSHFILSKPPTFIEHVVGQTAGDFMSTVDVLSVYRSDKLTRKVHDLLGEGNSYHDRTLYSTSLIPKPLVHLQLADVSRRAHNLVAMWDEVLYGNHLNMVLDIGSMNRKGRSFSVVAGPFGRLALPNTANKNIDIFLQTKGSKNTFPVPRYVWTIVYEPATQKAIVFVISNKVQKEVEQSELLCESHCSKLKWIDTLKGNNNFENASIGYTMCCDLHQFRLLFDNVPAVSDIEVKEGDGGLLTE